MIVDAIIIGIIDTSIIANSQWHNTCNENNSANNDIRTEISLPSLLTKGVPLRGDPTTKVTLAEFGDSQCSDCDRFFNDVEHQIDKEYAQTGKVNMIFKNFVHMEHDSYPAGNDGHVCRLARKFLEIP
ncbi:MAG: thioredoxin domain-containing protein [Thaumarchaeota archaeon]|nr:thioredoxin domain-containing protein [Nitrososphaerota archaeon]